MEFTQIKETGLYVADLGRTEAFYHGLLGLPVVAREEGRHIFFRAGSSILLCFLAEATRGDKTVSHYGEGQQHIAFEVPFEGYKEAKSWIRSMDIAIEHEQHWGVGISSFYFRDPDGHSLEIVPKGMWK